jgi:hypothetical protein
MFCPFWAFFPLRLGERRSFLAALSTPVEEKESSRGDTARQSRSFQRSAFSGQGPGARSADWTRRHKNLCVVQRNEELVVIVQMPQSGKAATKGIFTTEARRHRESQNQRQDPRARRWRRPRSGRLAPWGVGTGIRRCSPRQSTGPSPLFLRFRRAPKNNLVFSASFYELALQRRRLPDLCKANS